MPKYYFDLFRPSKDSKDSQEEEGHHFADDNAVREEAVGCARDLARNGKPNADERVIVTRQDGTVVHEAFLKERMS